MRAIEAIDVMYGFLATSALIAISNVRAAAETANFFDSLRITDCISLGDSASSQSVEQEHGYYQPEKSWR